MAVFGQVENLEPMEADAGVRRRVGIAGDFTPAQRQSELAAIVGPAVSDRAHHRGNHAGVGGRAVEVDESGNAAHGRSSSN